MIFTQYKIGSTMTKAELKPIINERIAQQLDVLRNNPWKNLGKGTSTIIGLTKKSIVYQRGNSKLYYSIDVFLETINRFNRYGAVQSKDLKAMDNEGDYYKNKPCHCTFFMILMEYLFGEKVKLNRKIPSSIEFDVE